MKRADIETILCIWEWMINKQMDFPQGSFCRFYELHGTAAMRQLSITLGPEVDRIWYEMTRDQQEMDKNIPFDWAFVPRVMESIKWNESTIVLSEIIHKEDLGGYIIPFTP